MSEAKHVQLAIFQLNVAARWRGRSAGIGDPFAQFYFTFAGFNALYYLWAKIDDVHSNETALISHLLGKNSVEDAAVVLTGAAASIRFFQERPPIERMDDRKADATLGDPREGRKARLRLGDPDPRERVKALGAILYLVRSNLVHGSKIDQGDDEEVIRAALPGLNAVLAWAIRFTETAFADWLAPGEGES